MYKICIECGQRLFSLHDWIWSAKSGHFFRKLTFGGFAIGPIMIYKEKN